MLSNAKMQLERLTWWSALARKLIKSEQRVPVLLDWTQVEGDRWALVASIPFRGRSFPIFAEPFDKSDVGSRDVHVAFLRALRRVLPERCTPVIVADGGFRLPFFIACQDLGVQFVVRLRNERSMLVSANGRHSFGDAFDAASQHAQCLGECRLYETSPHSTTLRVVLGPRPQARRDR